MHVGGDGLSHKRVGGAIAPTGCGGFSADRLGTIDLPRANRLNEEHTAFRSVWVQSHAIESRVSVVKSDRAIVPQ
jgi:hypothetical protein